jgi:hypothetical protein
MCCSRVVSSPLRWVNSLWPIAIIDDSITLVVLSLLQALTANDGSGNDNDNDNDGGGIKAAAIAVPYVSALSWLFVGGGIALYVMPNLLARLDYLERTNRASIFAGFRPKVRRHGSQQYYRWYYY